MLFSTASIISDPTLGRARYSQARCWSSKWLLRGWNKRVEERRAEKRRGEKRRKEKMNKKKEKMNKRMYCGVEREIKWSHNRILESCWFVKNKGEMRVHRKSCRGSKGKIKKRNVCVCGRGLWEGKGWSMTIWSLVKIFFSYRFNLVNEE